MDLTMDILEKVFGMVSKRMTLFIQEKLNLSEKVAGNFKQIIFINITLL